MCRGGKGEEPAKNGIQMCTLSPSSNDSSDPPMSDEAHVDVEAPQTVLTEGSILRPELMRGISLRKTLRQGGMLWLYNPSVLSLDQKEQVFAASKPTARFDRFLSHTWWTRGKWKMLSLLLHFGWPTMLVAWAMGVLVSFILCLYDVLPAFASYEVHAIDFHAQVPCGCWIMLAGFIAPIGGLMLFPYLPCRGSDTCFLDFVCINQTDSVQMQQGIQSIGHFLAASAELRVLWSAPLLSRLWCVFEIAAYRKLNPGGKIVIAPILNELLACQMFLWVQFFAVIFWLERTGPQGGNDWRMLFAFLGVFTLVFPSLAHVGWKKQLDHDKLESDLATFDLTKVECSNDFDRQCIHDAITHWYGSLAAFSEHVRGPFRLEVLELLRAGRKMSLGYLWLALSPVLCLSLEGLVGLWRAGAPIQSLVGFAASHMLAHDMLWLPSVVILYNFTSKRGLKFEAWGCKSFALEVLVFTVAFCVLFTGGSMVTALVASWGLGWVLAWICTALAVAAFSWGYCWQV